MQHLHKLHILKTKFGLKQGQYQIQINIYIMFTVPAIWYHKDNQRTNGPVNAHLISGPTVSTKKKKILTSIKGRNSVANLRNTIIYNTNIDLVNDDVYTKFGLIL